MLMPLFQMNRISDQKWIDEQSGKNPAKTAVTQMCNAFCLCRGVVR